MTYQEADVDADAPVERAEIVAERLPRPRHARLERRQRHALDLRHHAPQVVGVVGRSGASVKPQLPAIMLVTPCRFDGVAAGSQNNCAS